MYRSDASSSSKIRASALSMPNINMDFDRPTMSAAWVHTRSFAFASGNCRAVGDCSSSLLSFIVLLKGASHRQLLSGHFVFTTACASILWILSTVSSLKSLVISTRLVFMPCRAVDICVSIQARRTTSQTNLNSRSLHLASFSKTSTVVKDLSKAYSSVQIMNQLGPRYCLSSIITRINMRHSLWIASSFWRYWWACMISIQLAERCHFFTVAAAYILIVSHTCRCQLCTGKARVWAPVPENLSVLSSDPLLHRLQPEWESGRMLADFFVTPYSLRVSNKKSSGRKQKVRCRGPKRVSIPFNLWG